MWSVWALLVACGGGGGLQGKVVNGLTGAPVPGPYSVSAKAVGEASATCAIAVGQANPDGTFLLPEACAGVSYQLSIDKADTWVVDAAPVTAAGPESTAELVVWPAPAEPGIYLLDPAGAFTPVRTSADLQARRLIGSEEKVHLPMSVLADQIPELTGETRLVLVDEGPDPLTVTPVLPTGPHWLARGKRTEKDDENKVRLGPAWYFGVAFTDDKTITRPEATPDPGKVKEQKSGERAVRWWSSDALPPGRYGLRRGTETRISMIDVGGKAPPLPEDPEPPVPIE